MNKLGTTIENIFLRYWEQGADKVAKQTGKVANKLREVNKSARRVSGKKPADEIGMIRKGFRKMDAPLRQFSRRIPEVFEPLSANYIPKTRIAMSGFKRVMMAPMDEWKGWQQMGIGFNTMGGRMANRIRMLAHGMRGFRMEMLSVMFFGMAMRRFFMGLLKPALEASGIFQIFGAVLKIVFLPIALALLDVLLPIFNWFMNLPAPVKMAIGVVVLFGAILGTLLFIFGQITLGLGGVIMSLAMFKGASLGGAITALKGFKLASLLSFGGLKAAGLSAINGVTAILGKFATFLTGPIGIAIAAFALLWITNLGDFRKFVGEVLGHVKRLFTDIFGGILNVVKGVFTLITGILTLNGDKIRSGVGQIWRGVKSIITGIPRFVWNVLLSVVSFVGRAIGQIFGWFGKLWDKIRTINWLELGKKIITGIINGIKNWLWKIPSMIKGTISSIFGGFIGGMTTGYTRGRYGDFIYRAGQPPIEISPHDTVVGAKDVGKIGNTINFSPVVNIDANLSSDVDVRELGTKLMNQWKEDLHSLGFM